MAMIPLRTFAKVALLATVLATVGCGSESATLTSGDGGGSSDGTVDTSTQSSGGGSSSSSGSSSGNVSSGSGGNSSGAASGSSGAASGSGGDSGNGDGSVLGDASGTNDGGGTTSGDASPFQPDAAPGSCLQLGGACFQPSDCCSGTCTGGSCQFPACTSDGASCTGNQQCCSGICGSGGTCTPINASCGASVGNACTQNSQCCSQFCSNGVCSSPSFCQQNGDTCQAGPECCGGVCTIPSGQLYGTCSQPPSGAANCSMVDGTICGGVFTADAGTIPSCGGSCCSRLCAPYGPTGVLICQPASGCHVVGDVCSGDSDCCGSAGLPGPGSGNVTCNFSGGGTLGVCRNPISCKPNGDVCKLKTMSCNASCDCCSGNCETMDTCRQDNVGVPRCTGATCVTAGQACSTSADCCGGLPCVPNAGDTGPQFICYPGGSCVPNCGKCTINADCCVGQTCDMAQGTTSGVCGPCNPPPPPPDGGTLPDGGIPADGGAPSDGGTTSDGSTASDGGTPPDGAVPPSDGGAQGDSGADAGPCALYGQQCTVNSDCCNGIPCTSQRCISP